MTEKCHFGDQNVVVVLIVRLKKGKSEKKLVVVKISESCLMSSARRPASQNANRTLAVGCEMSTFHGWIEACPFFLYKWSIYNKGMFHNPAPRLGLFDCLRRESKRKCTLLLFCAGCLGGWKKGGGVRRPLGGNRKCFFGFCWDSSSHGVFGSWYISMNMYSLPANKLYESSCNDVL